MNITVSKHAQAKELLRRLWETEEGCLSIQMLQEFYVTATRKIAHSLTPQQALEIIATIGTWRIIHTACAAVQGRQNPDFGYDDVGFRAVLSSFPD